MTPHQTPPSVTDEMVKAAQDRVDEELIRQYAANPTWEEAKDVIENLDSAAIVTAALAAMPGVDEEVLAALKHAEKFISNGIELGFIRMPDAGTPDPAHDALPKVRAAIAKAEASRLTPSATGAEGWRPIESAPKTGRQIILYGHWKQFHGTEREAGSNHVNCGHYANGWVCEGRYHDQFIATHWQPLPAPPAAQEGK